MLYTKGASLQQLMIWGRWRSLKVAMGYMRESRLTKLENATFLDLNRNKLSKEVMKPMDMVDDEENIKPEKKNRKRKRKDTELDNDGDNDDDDGGIKEPANKRRKVKVKKMVKMLMDLMESMSEDSDNDS